MLNTKGGCLWDYGMSTEGFLDLHDWSDLKQVFWAYLGGWIQKFKIFGNTFSSLIYLFKMVITWLPIQNETCSKPPARDY